MRVDAAEFAVRDQSGDDGPVVSSAIGTGEERVLAVERNGSDRTFDGVGVDLDPTVIEEPGEAFPARECVADRLRELALLADERELCAQPRFEFGKNRKGSFLTGGAALVGAAAADVFFGRVQQRDASSN